MTVALGLGIGSKNIAGEWLETFFPAPVFQPSSALVANIQEALGLASGNITEELSDQQLEKLCQLEELKDLAQQLKGSKSPAVIVIIDEDGKASSTPEVYLKLHLLSHRLVKPHGINLDGIFGLLPNVAWTNKGPIDLSELPARQLQARVAGELLEVKSVDKFPYRIQKRTFLLLIPSFEDLGYKQLEHWP